MIAKPKVKVKRKRGRTDGDTILVKQGGIHASSVRIERATIAVRVRVPDATTRVRVDRRVAVGSQDRSRESHAAEAIGVITSGVLSFAIIANHGMDHGSTTVFAGAGFHEGCVELASRGSMKCVLSVV